MKPRLFFILWLISTNALAEPRDWFAQDTVFAADNETQALTGPVFYFVLHADPDDDQPDGVPLRWNRLKQFMLALQQRNQGLINPHHVTIMFTPAWGQYLLQNPDQQDFIRQWYQQGHELAFHSHTHNHAFPDGYSNGLDILGPDVSTAPGSVSLCWGDPQLGECTLDYGLSGVVQAFSNALGWNWFPSVAATGPTGNGGVDTPWGMNDNRCNPAQDQNGYIADTDGCLRYEWIGLVAQIPYASDHYTHAEALTSPGTAAALQGGARCMDRGDALQVYTLPHELLNTESGSTRVSKTVVLEAIDTGDASHRIGVVIHPISYQDGATGDVPSNARLYIESLFDEIENRGMRSVTLSTARVLDQYAGVYCF